jgi:hypothetical protein
VVLNPSSGHSSPPRLVATDLDGTLLDPQGEVSPRTRAALGALDARGVTVVFVTGRPIRWIEHLHEHVGGHGLAIVSNGGAVFDVRTETVIRHRPIPRPTAIEIAARLRRECPRTSFAMERLDGFAREPAYLPLVADRDDPDVMVGSLEDVYTPDVVKLLALDPESDPEPDAERYWSRVDGLVGDLVTTTWSSGRAMVEMSDHGVTKGSELQALCVELGIGADEVVAFGDMPNDTDMLAWAGASYAMANAHPSVLKVAGGVAPPNDQDGVAQVLESLYAL